MKSWPLGALIALLPALVLVVLIGWMTDWQFTYSLDDAYIHLALARGIRGFHYGINAGEFSAPSSSILWPFLMAPFAGLRGFWLAPLVVNSACLIGTLLVLQQLLILRFGVRPLPAWATATILAFCLNIYGLVFTGMEHSLQVLLVAIIARALALRRYGFWLWAALVVLPLIRYEGLAISVPVLGYLALQDQATRIRTAWAALVLAIGIVSFSIFLTSLGLGYLPSSVFAKQPAATAGSAFSLLRTMARSALANTHSLPTFTAYSFAVFAAFAAWSASRVRVLLLLVGPALLHLCLGRTGWFGRYEVSILLYLVLISADLLAQGFASRPERGGGRDAPHADSGIGRTAGLGRFGRPSTLAALLLIAVFGTRPLWQHTLLTPIATRNIQDQQVQMARIASRYLDRPVAINDLGAVALSSRRYVLDLWGLGSYQALAYRSNPNNDPRRWIAQLMAEKQVNHAMVYDSWFPVIPDNWIKVAVLRLPGPRVSPSSDVVSFYATSPVAAHELTEAVKRYKAENPRQSSMLHLLWSGPGKV